MNDVLYNFKGMMSCIISKPEKKWSCEVFVEEQNKLSVINSNKKPMRSWTLDKFVPRFVKIYIHICSSLITHFKDSFNFDSNADNFVIINKISPLCLQYRRVWLLFTRNIKFYHQFRAFLFNWHIMLIILQFTN